MSKKFRQEDGETDDESLNVLRKHILSSQDFKQRPAYSTQDIKPHIDFSKYNKAAPRFE